MSRPTATLLLALLLALVLALGATACGGGDDESSGTTDTTATETTTDEGSTAAGKEIFVANCASCHTLADAGASGSIGPDLDQLQPDQAVVEEQVRNGGGGMPAFADQLSDEEITEVSAYVAAATQG
jgi:mono/diheme cytochrome c family protein